MRIYVASSWRNKHQQTVVKSLRDSGHEVYDFMNPGPDCTGFHWSDIDPNWKGWTPEQYVKGLMHPIAQQGLRRDHNAMVDAELCVLVLPCGRSAHLEAGWFIGKGLPVIIYLAEMVEPELMYGLAHCTCSTMKELDKELWLVSRKSIAYPP